MESRVDLKSGFNKNIEILICDDSKLARKVLEKRLIELGYSEDKIRTCCSGDEVIEKYKDKKSDILFLDIVMPNKTGKETLKELKIFDKDIKVVMVSSVGTSKNVTETLKEGAIDFIQKPVEIKSIKEVIKKVTGGVVDA